MKRLLHSGCRIQRLSRFGVRIKFPKKINGRVYKGYVRSAKFDGIDTWFIDHNEIGISQWFDSAMVRIIWGVKLLDNVMQFYSKNGLKWKSRSAWKGWWCLLAWTRIDKVEEQLSEKGIRSYSRGTLKGIDQRNQSIGWCRAEYKRSAERKSINQGLFSIQTNNNNNIHPFVYMTTERAGNEVKLLI